MVALHETAPAIDELGAASDTETHLMIRSEPSSTARVAASVHVAARIIAALLILSDVGCSDGIVPLVDPLVTPTVDSRVATTLEPTLDATLSAIAGTRAGVPPIIVRDQRGVGLGGVTVRFAVTSGGGFVTSESAITNSAGIAAVNWTLGATPGVNTLSASVIGLPSVTFTARGTPPPSLPCVSAVSPFSAGTTIKGVLDANDCLSDAVFLDVYSTTLSGGAHLFKLSATFDSYLYLATPDWFRDFERSLIADNNNGSGETTNSAIKALLPAGSYILAATSVEWGAMGAYSLSSEKTSDDITDCEKVYIVRGVSTIQNIQASDCLRTDGPLYADEFHIWLSRGQSLKVSMESTAVDSFLELLVEDPATGIRSIIASNDNADAGGNKDARLAYFAAPSGYYVIVARTALNGQTGGYTLTVQ
jgi:hypothetical protein